MAALRMEMRLLKAVSLLVDPDAKIIYVAEKCGFNHLGPFNTCFKKRFGATPSQWRKAISRDEQKARRKQAEGFIVASRGLESADGGSGRRANGERPNSAFGTSGVERTAERHRGGEEWSEDGAFERKEYGVLGMAAESRGEEEPSRGLRDDEPESSFQSVRGRRGGVQSVPGGGGFAVTGERAGAGGAEEQSGGASVGGGRTGLIWSPCLTRSGRGDFRLLVTPSVAADWNDNINLSKDHGLEDYIFTPMVGLDASYPLTQVNLLRLDVGVGYDEYLEHRSYSDWVVNSGSQLSFDTYIKDFLIDFARPVRLRQGSGGAGVGGGNGQLYAGAQCGGGDGELESERDEHESGLRSSECHFAGVAIRAAKQRVGVMRWAGGVEVCSDGHGGGRGDVHEDGL